MTKISVTEAAKAVVRRNTEEVQGGVGARLIKAIVEKNLQREHQRWLEGVVAQTTESGRVA